MENEIIWDDETPAIKLDSPQFFLTNLSSNLQSILKLPTAPLRPHFELINAKTNIFRGEFWIQEFPSRHEIKIWYDKLKNLLKFENRTQSSIGVDPMWVYCFKDFGEKKPFNINNLLQTMQKNNMSRVSIRRRT